MGLGAQQKVAEFMGHRESQELRKAYSFLHRLRLDVPIKNARIDTAVTSIAGQGSSKDVIGEDPSAIFRDDRQDQPIRFGHPFTDQGYGRAAAIDPFHPDASFA